MLIQKVKYFYYSIFDSLAPVSCVYGLKCAISKQNFMTDICSIFAEITLI